MKKKKKPQRPSHEDLQQAAYYRWQKRGTPLGDDLADWHAVEKRMADEDEELDWDEEERRWSKENPSDDEPGEY
jgi:hypothetical protein